MKNEIKAFKHANKIIQEQSKKLDHIFEKFIDKNIEFHKSKIVNEDIIRDAERYRFMRNNTSVMLFEDQKWKTSHKLDWAVDKLMATREEELNGK